MDKPGKSRETQIQNQLQILHDTVEAADAITSVLLDRLTPALRNESVNKQKNVPGTLGLVPIATNIHVATMRLGEINARIRSAIELLEL